MSVLIALVLFNIQGGIISRNELPPTYTLQNCEEFGRSLVASKINISKDNADSSKIGSYSCNTSLK